MRRSNRIVVLNAFALTATFASGQVPVGGGPSSNPARIVDQIAAVQDAVEPSVRREVWSKLNNPEYWEQVAAYHCVTPEFMAGLAKGRVKVMALEYHQVRSQLPSVALSPTPKCKKPKGQINETVGDAPAPHSN